MPIWQKDLCGVEQEYTQKSSKHFYTVVHHQFDLGTLPSIMVWCGLGGTVALLACTIIEAITRKKDTNKNLEDNLDDNKLLWLLWNKQIILKLIQSLPLLHHCRQRHGPSFSCGPSCVKYSSAAGACCSLWLPPPGPRGHCESAAWRRPAFRFAIRAGPEKARACISTLSGFIAARLSPVERRGKFEES